jgi:hypothetical protein
LQPVVFKHTSGQKINSTIMKKSRFIKLALVSLVFTACKTSQKEPASPDRLYVRTDTTSNKYYHANGLMYYRFLPYTTFRNGTYSRRGYETAGRQTYASSRRGGFGIGRGFSGRG